MEVARRLKEREEREREEQIKLQHEKENPEAEERRMENEKVEQKFPPGVLSPLLRRHRDLDEELRARLAELEQK